MFENGVLRWIIGAHGGPEQAGAGVQEPGGRPGDLWTFYISLSNFKSSLAHGCNLRCVRIVCPGNLHVHPDRRRELQTPPQVSALPLAGLVEFPQNYCHFQTCGLYGLSLVRSRKPIHRRLPVNSWVAPVWDRVTTPVSSCQKNPSKILIHRQSWFRQMHNHRIQVPTYYCFSSRSFWRRKKNKTN